MPEKRTILVVDDEALAAKVTGKTLMSAFRQHELIVCTSPEEGIHTLRKKEVAVLLCDLQMPVYDGVYVLKKAFEANPHSVSILVTGCATKDGLMAAMNEGHVWRCIEKPWHVADLCRAVTDALNEYEKRRAAGGPKWAERPPGVGPQSHPKQIFIRRPKKPEVAPVRRVVFGRAKLQQKARQREMPSVLANRYRDLVEISEGGSGSVYRATDGLLNMTVAIKTIAERFAKKTESIAMLFNEARLAMQLSHRHIVRLHNVQESDGIYFLVMEYLSGATLRTILERNGPLSPEVILQIVGVCEEALGYAHRRQIYHRDLKPDNLMLTDDGILKVIDFGVACLALRDLESSEDMQGTPYYISPEEILGEPIDQRADVYSFGITVHELLTGSLPPNGGGTDDPLAYLPVAQEELPEPMRGVLQTSFSRERCDRWQDINEFAEKFREAYAMSYQSADA